MSAAKKIVRELSQEINKENLPFHGGFYTILNGVFPLIPISKKSHYESALRVLTTVSKALASGEYKSLEADLSAYAETLGLLIESYEKTHYPRVGEQVSGVEMLAFLMEQHGLSQSELGTSLGGQPNVSAILAGKRKLNARQIETLSKCFNVSPSVFFDVGKHGSRRDHRVFNLVNLQKKK